MRTRALVHGVLVVLLLLSVVPPVHAQEVQPDPVVELMDQMSAEAKVGQLVLVSFPGTDVGADTDIAALIRDYAIGGVLLRPENGNFGASRIAPEAMISLTNQLQQLAWESSLKAPVAAPGETDAPQPAPYIPLFIGATASLNRVPVTTFISGTATLPTPMALGAAWDRSLSEMTGNILGQELSAIGVNLFLGPNLDVLYPPRPGDPSDLGTSVFGGDPFWVGELGEAYIRGLHQGSSGRMLVVPRHLPGLGSADRSLEEEVPTVQKTLEQLKQVELAPFFAATSDLENPDGLADGLLVTHIRYRGFQGNNLRLATRPISLDAQALQSVLNLPEFVPWREAGGILVSDNLGLKSIHYSYDPRGLSFNGRRVARDALVAGNDLLTLDRFAANDNDWSAHFANIRDTLDFLAARYQDEATFRAIVDTAVYRLLSMKLRIYPEVFSLQDVQIGIDASKAVFRTGQTVSAEVALRALTRVFPISEDVVSTPPQEGESIVIFTQEYDVKPYEGYASFPILSPSAFRDVLLRFYGPDGTDLVRFDTLQSFTFAELQAALSTVDEEVAPLSEGPNLLVSAAILNALKEADWVVFATMGLHADDPSGLALKTFLSKQANLVTGRIAVFTFGPPYELDSTEVSKLDLFYALYSPGAAFVDVAARALFGDVLAPGSSPVDIPALNYQILQQTMPDPDQLISLDIVNEAGEVLTETGMSNILKGGVINLRTGTIVDHNGRPVPDGTQVQFILSYPQENFERTVAAEAIDGIATTMVTLDREGQLDVAVQSEPALSSVRLQLTIRNEGPVEVMSIAPTSTPTPIPTWTPTATSTPMPTPTPVVTQELPDPIYLPVLKWPSMLHWGLAGVFLIFVAGFFWAREREVDATKALRIALWGAAGGLTGYIVLIFVGQRWLMVWLYRMIGREFLAGAVAIVSGGGGLLSAVLISILRHSRTRDPADT